jgi:cytosine/adenosine deaminase-related metal-dependent hydrolase
MRVLADGDKSISPETILRMATINGARALGFSGKLGELSKGAFADLIAIPFDGNILRVEESVVGHSGNVAVSMIEGRWAIPPG